MTTDPTDPTVSDAEIVFVETNPFHGGNEAILDEEYERLSQPFVDALFRLVDHPDTTICGRCHLAVGFALVAHGDFDRVDWLSTGLLREGDGPIEVLCEICTRELPDDPEVSQ